MTGKCTENKALQRILMPVFTHFFKDFGEETGQLSTLILFVMDSSKSTTFSISSLGTE